VRHEKIQELMENLGVWMAGAGVGAAAGAFAWGAVATGSELFGPTIRRTGDASTIALTFDDGPNPAITPDLLALLDRFGAKATFFLIGERVRAYPALTKAIAERGHAIGNHTESHRALTFLPARTIRDELARCDEAIEAAAGRRARGMRPPWGYRGPQLQRVISARGDDRVVMWSFVSNDWRVQAAERVIQRLRGVRGGDIVLMHDGDHRVPEGDRRNTLAAMEYWLPRWNDAGLGFVTLDEMRWGDGQGGENQ
jgi:peptidoglycan/xylan/chitin deacetylase (PgdA/CDA1 family)